MSSTPRPLDFTGPIVQMRVPQPLDLWIEVTKAIEKSCRRRGLECYFMQEDGLGVIHVRPVEREEHRQRKEDRRGP